MALFLFYAAAEGGNDAANGNGNGHGQCQKSKVCGDFARQRSCRSVRPSLERYGGVVRWIWRALIFWRERRFHSLMIFLAGDRVHHQYRYRSFSADRRSTTASTMATATTTTMVTEEEGIVSTTMTGMPHIHRQCNDDRNPQHRHQNQHLPSSFSYECTIDNYDRAVAWCREIITSGQQHSMALFSIHSFHTELSSASQQLDMPFESLHSLFRNVHISYMKRTSHTLRSSTMRHVKSYLNGCSILDLAKKANCPPTMMSRLIVENVAVTSAATASAATTASTQQHSSTNTNSTRQAAIDATLKKKLVSEALRHPEKNLGCASTSLLPEYLFSENAGRGKRKKWEDNHDMHDDIPLSRLSIEVREAVDSDPMYGKRETWRMLAICNSLSNTRTKCNNNLAHIHSSLHELFFVCTFDRSST